MNRHISLRVFCALMMLLTLFSFLSSCKKSEAAPADGFSSVRIDGSGTSVSLSASYSSESVSAYSGRTVYLFELYPWEDNSDAGVRAPLSQSKMKSSFSFSVPLRSGAESRLYSRFILAVKNIDGGYDLISPAKYIENPEILSLCAVSSVKRAGIKGISGVQTAEAQLLGASYTLLTVSLSDYVTFSSQGSNITPYISGDTTCYFKTDRLAYLDHTVKTLCGAGMNVYMQVVLGAPSGFDYPAPASFLYLDTDGASSVYYYCPDYNSPKAVGYYTAVFSFLASRYSQSGMLVSDFVLGSDLDDIHMSSFAGQRTPDDYAAGCASLARALNTAVLSKNASARLFIPISGICMPSGYEGIGTNGTVADRTAIDFLAAFSESARENGGFGWELLLTVRPGAGDADGMWNNTAAAENGFDTTSVTMKNIGVLTSYLAGDAMLYNGRRRALVINEYINPTDGTSAAEKTAAASYAYSYCMAEADGSAEALILSVSGIYGDCGGLYDADGKKRALYNAVAAAGTGEPDTVLADELSVTGAASWEALTGYKTASGTVYTAVFTGTGTAAENSLPSGASAETMFDFSQGLLSSFYPSDGTAYIDIVSDTEHQSVLYAQTGSAGCRYCGPGAFSLGFETGKSTSYIALTVKLTAPAEHTGKIPFVLLLSSGTAGSPALYTGSAAVTTGEWTTLVFDISDYAAASGGITDCIKLWTETDGAEGFGLYAESITLYKARTNTGGVFAILLIATLLILLAAFGAYRLYKAGITPGSVLRVLKDSLRRKTRAANPQKDDSLRWAYPDRTGNTGELPRITDSIRREADKTAARPAVRKPQPQRQRQAVRAAAEKPVQKPAVRRPSSGAETKYGAVSGKKTGGAMPQKAPDKAKKKKRDIFSIDE